MRAVLILLLVLGGPGVLVAQAQTPTSTPSPTPIPIPLPTSTPSFTIGITRIILPTMAAPPPGAGLFKTPIPLDWDAINNNPLSKIQIDPVEIVAETNAMSGMLFRIMGGAGYLLHFITALMLAFGIFFYVTRIFKRGQAIFMAVRNDVSFRLEHGIGMGMGMPDPFGGGNRGFDRGVRDAISDYNTRELAREKYKNDIAEANKVGDLR